MVESSPLDPLPSPNLSNRADEDWQAVAPSFERILQSARPFRPAIAALVDETTGRQHKQQLRELLDALEGDASVDAVFDEGRNIAPLRIEAIDWRPEKERDTKRPSLFSLQEDSAAGADNVIWRTVAYPATLTLALLGFALFMWSILIPEFRSMFQDFGLPLPWLTELIFNASPFIIAGMVLCIIILVSWMFLPSLVPTALRKTISFRLPGIGKIYRNAAYGKFCHVLSIMLGAGAPREAAIRVAGRATLPDFVVQELGDLAKYDGHSCPSPSTTSNRMTTAPSRLPKRLALLLQSDVADTERSTALRELAADFYFRSSDGSQSYFEPIIVFVAGLMVGLTIIGLFMPLTRLITNLSG